MRHLGLLSGHLPTPSLHRGNGGELWGHSPLTSTCLLTLQAECPLLTPIKDLGLRTPEKQDT